MEFITCKKCGGDTPAILSRCRHCGERLVKQQQLTADLTADLPKERKGFVTILLWLFTTVSVWFTLVGLCSLFLGFGLWNGTPEPLYIRFLFFLSGLLISSGFIMLLHWYKPGFYILSGMALVNTILWMVMKSPSLWVLVPGFSMIILYMSLQCSKNGKTCWEQLGFRFQRIHPERNVFVSGWIYYGIISSCFSTFWSGMFLPFANEVVENLIFKFWLVYNVGNLAGFIILNKGYRIGFYLIAAVNLILGIYSLIYIADFRLVIALSTSFTVMILFAVLQIRKNGKSYWELLS